MPNLKELGTGDMSKQLPALVLALKPLQQLRKVRLHLHGPDAEGHPQLGGFLKDHPRLEVLTLSGTEFQNKLKAVVDTLTGPNQHHLKALDLRDASDVPLSELIRLIRNNSRLAKLSVYVGAYSEKQLEELAKAIQSNATLQMVEINPQPKNYKALKETCQRLLLPDPRVH